MNRNTAFFALALCAALLLPGCSEKKAASATMTPVSSAVQSNIFQPASSRAPSAPRQSAASSREEVSSASPEESEQNGPVKTVSTDNESFNKKFKDNPLDAAYVKEMNGAISTVAMVQVSDKYADLWQKEISHAYDLLKTALAADSTEKWRMIESEQKKWEDGRDAALKKITDAAASAGGSVAKVNAASGAMDFYRDRAAALYESLYEMSPDYDYEFES